jgi:hypothetical protein
MIQVSMKREWRQNKKYYIGENSALELDHRLEGLDNRH